MQAFMVFFLHWTKRSSRMPNEAEQEVAAPAASNRGVLQTFSRTQAKPASSGVKAAGFQGLPPSFLFSAERSVPSIVGKTRILSLAHRCNCYKSPCGRALCPSGRPHIPSSSLDSFSVYDEMPPMPLPAGQFPSSAKLPLKVDATNVSNFIASVPHRSQCEGAKCEQPKSLNEYNDEQRRHQEPNQQ